MRAAVAVSEREGVLVVRLDRPGTRNAIGRELASQLADVLEAAASADIGAIVLLAAGDHFCVGGDVRAMAAADDPGLFVKALADEFHRAVRAIAVGVPVVAGVRGWAAGAGFSLALAADIVIAGAGASFRPAYPALGASPDGGLTWTLPRAVGPQRAKSILLRNMTLSAAEAVELGLVARVVPDAAVDDVGLEEAAALARGPRDALRATKRLLAEGVFATLPAHLDAEAAAIGASVGSADGREGVAAFVGRRSARFGSSQETSARQV